MASTSPAVLVLALACHFLPAASVGDVSSMRLYDDVRTQYAFLVFDRFASAVSDLAIGEPKHSLARRFWLLRSVDVMSYTVGVQSYLEEHPPIAIHSSVTGATLLDGSGEGARLWSNVADPQDPQAHERRILDRLFSGLRRSLKSKLLESQQEAGGDDG